MSSESNEKDKPPDKSKNRKSRMTGFEQWGGYMASKKMKLAAQFDDQRDINCEEQDEIKSDIFRGISIFVNGYTKPSADELKKLMMLHGGSYHYYYSTTKTTHIIASNLPYSKLKNLKNQIVVTPDWITDSIKAGKLLPYQSYFLYPPEVINKQQRLKLSDFTDSKSSVETVNNNNPVSKCGEIDYPEALKHFGKDVISLETFKEVPKNISLQSCSNNDFSSSAVSSDHSKNSVAKVFSPIKTDAPVTAGHPAFLSEFYSHSRLHHISTAGQELKRYVHSLVDGHSSRSFTGRDNLRNIVKNGNTLDSGDLNCNQTELCDKNQPVIMHLDMDCFFVSVGLRNHPELRGQPVAVTHSKGKRGGAQEGSDLQFEASHYTNQSKKKLEGLTSTDKNNSDDELLDEEPKEQPKISKYSKDYGSLSEIASCSYEARKAGVRNGMFLGEAMRRCPNLKTIPYDFEGYSEVSKQLYDIVASYTLNIEAVSCDELFIDCTTLLKDTGASPLQFASVLRAEIEQKTKCTASAGIGPNMLIARLANKVAKPNGQFYVSNEKVKDFILQQKIKDLPGVGYSTSIKFENMGVITCGDLQSWSISKLQQEFGPKTGQTLYNRCRGKDNRVVQLQKERKSVSAEINYGIRFEKEEEVFSFLKELSVEVVNRLKNINSKGRSITLKLMVRRPDAPIQTAKFMGHGICDHITKSIALKSATNDANLIGHECCMLVKSLKIKPEDYRGIGIQLSKLEPVQKDIKDYSIKNLLGASTSSSETQSHSKQEIFAPKELAVVNKSLPKGSSVKDFFSDKSSPLKQQSNKNQSTILEEEGKTLSDLPLVIKSPQKSSSANELSDKALPKKHSNVHQAFSLEELDQSVLNALPEDLQKEVLEMYGNKTSTKPASSLQHSTAVSRTTKSTSSKSNKMSSKKSSSLHATKKTPTKQNTLLDCLTSHRSNSSDDTEESIFKKKASIGGAENINEVRSLVKEWVLSSQVVLEEDIDQFRDYILQVIDEDLRKVDLVLKYFHRVVSTANALWQQAYLTILSYVQQKMLQKYGTMLDAKCDFT